MINFIVCGLEGTLIDENNKTISEETIDLIATLLENDFKFAVATGLNYNLVKPLFGKIQDEIIYICNDGGVIFQGEKVISKTTIDRLVCLDVLIEMEKDEYNNDIRLVFSNEKDTAIKTHDYEFLKYLNNKGIEPEHIDDLKELNGDVTKITLCSKDGFDEKSFEKIYKRWSAKANVSISSPNEMFITGQYVTKGMAIALIQHFYEISEEDTVVFGTGFTDIDMFEHCFYSYAMQWADSQVRHAAKHITESVDTILEDIMRM